MTRQEIDNEIEKRKNLFMKEADMSPISIEEKERVRALLIKYKPSYL